MAEKYNFIPAADLPVTDADAVDVLCVENGELKRKPEVNLGGGAGGYIIHVPASEVNVTDDGMVTVILSESRDNFAPILEAGGSVWIDMSEYYYENTEGMMLICNTAVAGWIWGNVGIGGDSLVMFSMDLMNNSMLTIMCFNGTWTPGAVTASSEGDSE